MSGPENGDPFEHPGGAGGPGGTGVSGGPMPAPDTGLYDDLAGAPGEAAATADEMGPGSAGEGDVERPAEGSGETRRERKARLAAEQAARKEEARRAKRPRAVGALLRHPLSLSVVIIGALLGFVMTFAYVGAFADPTGELHDLPMGLVILDQPQEVAGQRIAIGEQLVAALNKPQEPALPVEFRSYASRDEAVAALQRNDIVGAIVVPADLSRTIGAIGTAAASGSAVPKAARVEVIVNDGAGSLQPAVVERVGLAATSEVSGAVAAQLASTLEGLDVSLQPADVASVSNPVSATFSRVPALDGKTGRGLPPFYTAVMVTLTGLVGMTAIHVCVGTLLGRDHLELFGRILRFKRIPADPLQRWKTELLLSVPLSALGGAAITWMAVWIVGVHDDQPWHTMLFAMLGVFAMSALSLLFLTAFGVAGDLLVLLITTIFGVPSARGVYPWEALPAFFRLLGEVLPMRYLTDGMRALFFFDGLADAGLRRGIIAVSIWGVGSVVVGYFVALVCRRRALAATEVVAPVASAA